MYTCSCLERCAGWRKARKILLSAVVFALAAGLALPARAGDDQRAVKSRVAPVYPEIAKRLKITGEVKLEALVNAEGKVKSVKAVSGNHMLGAATGIPCVNGDSSPATVTQWLWWRLTSP